MERETMRFDVVIVGAGPAGLAAAIRLKQLAQANHEDWSICVLEKGAEVGAHTLSGAVLDPRSLAELIPDYRERGAPVGTPVREDLFLFLTADRAYRTPSFLLPACFQNHGNTIVRAGLLVQWLGKEAEALGVEIFPGFAAADLWIDEENRVRGIITGDMGRHKDGSPGPNFQPGIAIEARYTLFAEGCRGHLGKQLEARYQLRDGKDPQKYGIGIKELWRIPKAHHQPGLVMHTAGWPLDPHTYGGSFCYHLEEELVAIGFVVGLDYRNPYLSPFEEFQRFKTHPAIRPMLEGGERLAYGARALVAGGLQSLPKLTFPGGALIGDDAGFLNASRIKGIHAAIKSGMLAAEATAAALAAGRSGDELSEYPERFAKSWLYDELYRARNFKPLMHKGLYLGSLLFGIDQLLLRGKAPWTLHHQEADHEALLPAAACRPIAYPKPDGIVAFDRLSSVFLSNTNHEEDQPCHLVLKDPTLAIRVNLAQYAAPEQRYCPAGVYEIVDGEAPRLVINAQNCVHCKTCDIKDPMQNIQWVTPQGGEGPIYQGM